MLQQFTVLQTCDAKNIWNTKHFARCLPRNQDGTCFSQNDVSIDAGNVEECHWCNSRNSAKKVSLKLTRRKDPDNISGQGNNLKRLT